MTVVLPAAPPGVVEEIAAFGRLAASRGWIPATSGNFSCRVDLRHAAVTRSGIDKGAIRADDLTALAMIYWDVEPAVAHSIFK